MREVSVIFDAGATYLCSFNKRDFVEIEDKIFPRKNKVISKGLEVSRFSIVEYYIRNKNGCMIELQDQSYYLPGFKNGCV